MSVKEPDTSPSAAAKGDIWVFESSLGGEHLDGIAAMAVKHHGAEVGRGSGAAGNSYALQTRDDEHVLLRSQEIEDHVQEFRDYATAHPEVNFRLLPGSGRKSAEEHAKFADLLRNVPANCELTGRILEILGRLKTVRIILLDANVSVVDTDARKHALDQYFAANEGLWNAEQIEIVSFGAAQTLIANDKYAKGRRYSHRIIDVNREIYGDDTAEIREILSLAYSTKLVCLDDPNATSTTARVGVIQRAALAGLEIEAVLID